MLRPGPPEVLDPQATTIVADEEHAGAALGAPGWATQIPLLVETDDGWGDVAVRYVPAATAQMNRPNDAIVVSEDYLSAEFIAGLH